MVHLLLPEYLSRGRESILLRGGTQASNWRSVASTSYGPSGPAHDMTARTALAGLKCGPAGSNGGTHRPTLWMCTPLRPGRIVNSSTWARGGRFPSGPPAPCRNLPDSICEIDHVSVIPVEPTPPSPARPRARSPRGGSDRL